MCKQEKIIRRLRKSSRWKLLKILEQLGGGCDSREIPCHRLYHRSRDVTCMSIRLSKAERAIVLRSKNCDVKLLFAGTHEEYNQLIGARQKKRLGGNPWC